MLMPTEIKIENENRYSLGWLRREGIIRFDGLNAWRELNAIK